LSEVVGDTKVVRISGVFAKGHAKIGGRQKGTPNRITGNARQVKPDKMPELKRETFTA
jgi:hypothetical protein